MVKRLDIKTKILPQSITARALDGKFLFNVTHVTEPVVLSFFDKHTELISFHVFNSAQHPLILGYPWLIKHNPHIDWRSGRISEWGLDCLQSCFGASADKVDQEHETITNLAINHIQTKTEPIELVGDPDFPDLTKVPPCYLDLKDVFNKSKATSLPPHRAYDCAIDLLPGGSHSQRQTVFSLGSGAGGHDCLY